MKIKLATFNLKNDHWPILKTYWEKRKSAVFDFFQEESPDIVGTQELSYQRIVEMLSMLPEYEKIGVGRGGGQSGEFSAIFYKKEKYTCLDCGTFWLSGHPAKERSRGFLAMFPRICTWGLFSQPNNAQPKGDAFAVFNTHLDHISPFARQNGLSQIDGFIRDHFQDLPVILMGDFNAKPESKAVRSLKANEAGQIFTNSSFSVFHHTNSRNGRTYHGFRGGVTGEPIDYIFTSQQFEMKDTYVVSKKFNGRYPSDHFPIVADCILKGSERSMKTDYITNN